MIRRPPTRIELQNSDKEDWFQQRNEILASKKIPIPSKWMEVEKQPSEIDKRIGYQSTKK